MEEKKIIKPEGITDEQIKKIQDRLGEELRRVGFEREPTERVIKHLFNGLMRDLVTVVVTHFRVGAPIIRQVEVDRNLTPEETLLATHREQLIDLNVVKAMPKGDANSKKVEVVLFKIQYNMGHEQLEEEYESRELMPADPYTLSGLNRDDQIFADSYPNLSHWKNADGRWCHISFLRWHDLLRYVNVNFINQICSAGFWAAGIRKKSA